MSLLRSIICSLCLVVFGSGLIDSHEYNLAVCAIFKDNAPFLKEWIEYHRLVGVDHFYLFDNSSSDYPERILKKYLAKGIVTLIHWPNRSEEIWGEHIFAWVVTTQAPAYARGCALAKNKAKWLAFIDSDEFLVPMSTSNLTDFLNAHDDAPGICLNWVIYGTSDVYDIPKGKLLIEMLTRRAPMDHNLHGYTKVIVKPEEFAGWSWVPHVCNYKSGNPTYYAAKDEARINHYYNRTIKYFYEYKIEQKRTMDNVPAWNEEAIQEILKLGNDEEDNVMERFIPSLRDRMGFMKHTRHRTQIR